VKLFLEDVAQWLEINMLRLMYMVTEAIEFGLRDSNSRA
jgi:hypothetical protein